MNKLIFASIIYLCILVSTLHGQPNVVINEFLASNGSGIEDEDEDTVPWIELYNAGDETADLSSWGLSNDADDFQKWTFPEISLESGEFLLVFASGKNRSHGDAELHANFRISQSGEAFYLTDAAENLIDEIAPIALPTNVSYGRQPDGSDNWYYFDNPTPGASNNESGLDTLLEAPEFSHSAGFYTSEFYLSLETDQAGAEIRYTLDGSEPNENSLLYSEPILIKNRTEEPNNLSSIRTVVPGGVPLVGYDWYEPDGQVFKGNVVRAKVMRSGDKSSPIITKSFFVDELGADRFSLPVVSLVTDSLNLFDYETGIYIPGKIYDEEGDGDHQIGNYNERGREWERPAAFELFSQNGEIEHVQNIGIRLHGGGSRAVAQKSLRLYARNDYGENRFYHQIFPDLPYANYNRLILRNSGQDFFARSTMFRDIFMQTLIQDLNLDTQAHRSVVVFINGEYWGIQNIRERYDEDYLARTYGVDEDRLDILTRNRVVSAGRSDHYDALMNYIERNDSAEEQHYQHIQNMMDVDNFLDYIVAQAFVRNVDWPGNNIDYWRSQTNFNPNAPPGHDGRWRWKVVDLDAGFGLLNPWRVESFDMIRHMTNDRFDDWPNPAWSTLLIRRLFRNQEFRNEFINRSADYMNTIFHPNNVTALIDEFESRFDPVIEEHIKRWGQIESKDRWHFNVERMRNFAENRPEYHYQHIEKYFGIEERKKVTVDVSGLQKGRVQINSILIDEETKGRGSKDATYPWTGVYFKDIPIVLKAIPFTGHRFSHWEGSASIHGKTSAVIEISPSSDISAKAVFTPFVDGRPDDITPSALVDDDYSFTYWSADAEPGSFPESMQFQYMVDDDPGLRSEFAGVTSGAYNLTERTRINGLGEDGFSFINTGNASGNEGYPGRKLGAAVLALDTRGIENLRLSWTGGTVEANSRMYNLRLQYRVDKDSEFRDLRDVFGNIIEYQRNEESGHSEHFADLLLPAVLQNKPHVELRWKYYHTGERMSDDSGARDELRIADIHVTGDNFQRQNGREVSEFEILPNYPNPFNDRTVLRINLPEDTLLSITIFDTNGRIVKRVRDSIRLSAGFHTFPVDASGFASGLYFYQVQTPEWTGNGRMTLIR